MNSLLCGKGFIIYLNLIDIEIAVSCKDVAATVTAAVRGTSAIIAVSGTSIVCNVYVMTRSKCRSIIVVAIGCIVRTGHISLEIAISIIVSQ